MCGIAGFIDNNAACSVAELARTAAAMAATLRHRGPDDVGVWVDPASGVVLAHRRLAILDLSPAGHQPMRSTCGRYVLTYNGEIYNHPELRAELSALGRKFRGHSDTEVLVEALAEWGVEATLGKLIGMFAFALFDCATCTLTLVRDRLGIKPLFWARFGKLFLFASNVAEVIVPKHVKARFGKLFLFASELKALRAHPGWQPKLDPESLGAYLRWGHVPAPYSIYRGVYKLLPGKQLTLTSKGELRISSYWDPAQAVAAAQAERLSIAEAEAVERLDSLLGDAVARRMVADVPVGAFFSGGIDSSLIVALMQARSSRPVHTFTVGFREKNYDEAVHARKVASYLGTAHAEVVVSPEDALALVPKLPYWFDEPLLVRSQIPAMLVSALARREVTVALCGDGADELFGGYPGYFLVHAIYRATSGLPQCLRRLAANALDGLIAAGAALARRAHRPGWPLNQARQITAVVRAGGGIPELYVQLYSATAGPLPLADKAGEHPLLWQRPRHLDAVDHPITRMGYFALLGTLVDRTLAKVDRASMAYGLEVRVPFLDHHIVEYAWRLPPALKYASPGKKPLLRRPLYRYLPPELVDRPKKGFSCPLPVWLRGPLREWAEALLDERQLREEGLFDPVLVRQCWNQHLAGSANYWQLLWSILMFRQWQSYWGTATRPTAAELERTLATPLKVQRA